MAHLKKTIHSFVLVMLFTQNVMIMPMDHHFAPTPVFHESSSHSFVRDGSSALKNMFFSVSNSVTNNPKVLVIVAAGCVFAVVCRQVYKVGMLPKGVVLNASTLTAPIQAGVQSSFDKLPLAMRLPIQVIIVPLKTLMRLLRAGVAHYITHNKIHLGMTAVSMISGYVTGYPMSGALLGGGIFVHGAFNNRFDVVEQKIDGVDRKIDANHAVMLGELTTVRSEADEHKQEIITQIDEKTNKLSDALSGVDLRITEVGAQVNKNIKDVAGHVITVRGDVKGLSEQIEGLKSQLDQVNQDGVQRDKKALQLSEQMQESAAHLEAQMNGLNEKLAQQGKVTQEVRTEQALQGNMLSDIHHKVEEMIKIKSEHSTLLEVFQSGQTANRETLKVMQEGQAKIEKAATEFSVFYQEFSGLKSQFTRLESAFNAKQENDTRVFDSMGKKQSEVDGRLNEIEGGVDSIRSLVLDSQRQNAMILATLNRLDKKQDQTIDRPSLKNSPESPRSVPFVSEYSFQFPTKFNTFGPKLDIPKLKGNPSSSARRSGVES